MRGKFGRALARATPKRQTRISWCQRWNRSNNCPVIFKNRPRCRAEPKRAIQPHSKADGRACLRTEPEQAEIRFSQTGKPLFHASMKFLVNSEQRERFAETSIRFSLRMNSRNGASLEMVVRAAIIAERVRAKKDLSAGRSCDSSGTRLKIHVANDLPGHRVALCAIASANRRDRTVRC